MGDTETYGLQNSSVMRKRPDGQRIGLAADWAALNPILEGGEIGVTSDTNVLKVGDGTTRWSSLTGISGGGGGAVSSVDGQTGAVTLSGSYVPLAGASAGKVPIASSGSTVSWQAPSVLPGPMEKVPFYLYGHSYWTGVGTSGGRDMAARMTARTGTTVTNRSLSGASMFNRFQEAWTNSAGGGWTPGTQGVVLLDSLINEAVRGNPPTAWATGQDTDYTNLIKNVIRFFRAGSFKKHTDVSVTKTGFATTFNNACQSSNTADLLSIAVPSGVANFALIMYGLTAAFNPGGEYRVDGGAWTSFGAATTMQFQTGGYPIFFPITLAGTGHTVEVRPVTGKATWFYGWADRANATPPSFIVVKDVPLNPTGYGNGVALTGTPLATAQANLAAGRAAIDAVLLDSEFNDGTVVVADPVAFGWNENTMLSADNVHPHAVGHWVYANAVQTAANTLAMRVGHTPL